jgi:hypothetical protein
VEDNDSDSDADDGAPGGAPSRAAPQASSSNAPVPPPDTILRFLAQLHSDGYSHVAYIYIAKHLAGKGPNKQFRTKAQLQLTLAAAVAVGQVIERTSAGGRVLSLPPLSPFRRPVRVGRAVRAGESEFAPLLKGLPGSGPVTRKVLRKYIKLKLPDAPYGQTPTAINNAITRACEAGVVNFGGAGKKAWVSKK